MQPLSADGASIPGTAKEVSFERCFEEHFVAIHRFIARRVGVPLAEDLAAETFATALRRLPDFDPSGPALRSWLFGIAANLVRNQWRAEQRMLEKEARWRGERTCADPSSPPEADLGLPILNARMAGALALLPSEQREVLLLHAWAELTNEEIASTLGIAGGTVRSRLSRARSTLRSALVDVGPRRGSADVLGDHAQDARP